MRVFYRLHYCDTRTLPLRHTPQSLGREPRQGIRTVSPLAQPRTSNKPSSGGCCEKSAPSLMMANTLSNVATFSLNVLPLQHAPLAACAPIVSCMLDTAIQHAPKCLVGQTNAHVSCNRHAMVTLRRKATRAGKAEANSRAHAYTPSTHQKGGMTCVRWHIKRLWPSA